MDRSKYLSWQGPSTLYPIGYGLDFCVGNPKSSSWAVDVQRLLQPTRELVKSGYEARVESQGSVITRWLGKNKLSYSDVIDKYL